VKPPFKVPFVGSGFEHKVEDYLKWRPLMLTLLHWDHWKWM